MCREMSRITLEVVNIRVERLQNISPADACAEGAAEILFRPYGDPLREEAYSRGEWIPDKEDSEAGEMHAGSVAAFSALWDSINGRPKLPKNPRKRRFGRVKKYLEKTDVSWAANPWVWVVEFKKCV